MYQVANTMELIRSYSGPVSMLILLTVSDYLLYKPIIVALPLCSSITYILMTGSPSLTRLRVSTHIIPNNRFNQNRYTLAA